jgi:N-acetylglucosamine-6-phosphate deacetylase
VSAIAPGYVDLQVNGYGGVDFTSPDLTVEDIHGVTRTLAQAGVSAYCPTVITAPDEVYRHNLPLLAEAMRDLPWGGRILGIHLEGPCFNPNAVGAHPRKQVRAPDMEAFKRWNEWADGQIVLHTLAPELPGAISYIEALASEGVVCSLGHHLADANTTRTAMRAGARICTHLGNGVPITLHRYCNPIIDQLAEPEMQVMFIPDGQHIPLNLIRLIRSAKRTDQLIAVSDCAPIAGMPPGEYTLWGKPVRMTDDRGIRQQDGESLAGSAWNLAECMRWLRDTALFSETELMALGRNNALRLLQTKRFVAPRQKTP